MDLLIQCNHCQGKGIEHKYSYPDKNTTIIEKISCHKCNGKGQKVKKGHYLSYELLKTKRELNYLCEILQHKRVIPATYFYDNEQPCHECNGEGYINHETIDGNKTIIKKEKCSQCNGKGYIKTKTKKDIYNEIFDEYIGLKKYRSEIVQALKNKEWEDEKYKDYNEAHPYGYWEVCVRCASYNDDYACMGCVNESMCPENGCYFEPIDEKAKQWFVDKGYKKCIGYEPKYKWWRDKYMVKTP